jgi:chromosome segregation ATPase
MTQDVTQWIAEVRTLQRQLADTRKERDQAYNSAANWRRLYDNEARQRRQETEQFQTQIESLQQLLQQQTQAESDRHTQLQGLETAPSLNTLQDQLDALVSQCHSLTQQLDAERQAHAQTRQTLTAALGDTFDMLKMDNSLAIRPLEMKR